MKPTDESNGRPLISRKCKSYLTYGRQYGHEDTLLDTWPWRHLTGCIALKILCWTYTAAWSDIQTQTQFCTLNPTIQSPFPDFVTALEAEEHAIPKRQSKTTSGCHISQTQEHLCQQTGTRPWSYNSSARSQHPCGALLRFALSVNPSVCIKDLENYRTDFYEIWYRCHVILSYYKLILFSFLQSFLLTWQILKLERRECGAPRWRH